ncbi:hypothetical protein GC106_26300 [Kibdelosporangium sp. 4NS15]|uniref:DUF4232 domain-containing protein n=1 Tax=Kibdelosporangium persicum TaxID=2698649 RepID=A0ABX2F265_9PSEU|nr:DUF4232 domain-containing protein [Kibdelosporangium persicum]NRN65419.1 hypothetical protein [Kibdelosporangium persicum]
MRHLIILTTLLLTACGSPPPPAPPPPAPAPKLVIQLGAVDAAMGLRSLDIQLTNQGTAPAQINGYADIRILDHNRQPIDAHIGHGTAGVATVEGFDAPPQPITLEPGHTVHAGLLWRNLVTQTDRKATQGAYLDIAPAPGQAFQTVEPDGGIDLGNTTTLGLSAWKTITP